MIITKRYPFLILLLCSFLSGCTTIQNNRLPFSTFTGKEVILQREVVLSEYAAYGDQQLWVLWEDGKPTEFVIDTKFLGKPVREVKSKWGDSRSLYPLANYPKRVYGLTDSLPTNLYLNERMEGGPVEIFHLPIGTPVTITKSYTYNGIDSVCHRSDGTVIHPQTKEKVQFDYLLGCSDTIDRAPWEDESVPEKRFVGWDGKSYRE